MAAEAVSDADDILRRFKADLDRHFGMTAESPVNPNCRPTTDTMARFTDLCREDDWQRAMEERMTRLERQVAEIKALLK